MNKKFGKNEASNIGKKNIGIMIVSIIAVTLFIGTAMQPVLATTLSSGEAEEVKEECIPCRDEEKLILPKPKCKTCAGAVIYAVIFMIEHVWNATKEKEANDLPLIYPLWTAELALTFVQGIVMGLADSGFNIKVDWVDLLQFTNNTVNKLVVKDYYTFPGIYYLAILVFIPVGITGYLLKLCKGD